MRDRNLNLQQFNIQLTRAVQRQKGFKEKTLLCEKYFSQKCCLWRSDPETPNSVFQVFMPKDFRLLRSLAISHWFMPENLYWLYHIELEEQTFSQLNRKQQIELKILLSSRSNCVKYLFMTQRYSANEIFGNLVGNDLNDLSRVLKLKLKKQAKARKKVFRRGPTDQGTRRSDSSSKIIETECLKDVWLSEIEQKRCKSDNHLQQSILRILVFIENWEPEVTDS